MKSEAAPTLEGRILDELVIDDEASFAHVGLYADLREVLRRDAYEFRVLPATSAARWDRALLLNLTFWASGEGGGDVLVDDHVAADVVAHVAWHHLAARALSAPKATTPGVADPKSTTTGVADRPSAAALFLGEAIASAFDVYLVGRLLGHAPRSAFLRTQVPAMAATADAAGLSAAGFEQLLERIAGDPERAFEDLRELLVDATGALLDCASAAEALAALARFDGHAFAALLHRHELSNWVLYARAYGAPACGPDETVRALDRVLRDQDDALGWLAKEWVEPAIRSPPRDPGHARPRRRALR
jgi:hypothetical protein